MGNYVTCDYCGGRAPANEPALKYFCSNACRREYTSQHNAAKQAKKDAKAAKQAARAEKKPKEKSALGQASFGAGYAMGEKLGDAIGSGLANMWENAGEEQRRAKEAEEERQRQVLELEERMIKEDPKKGLQMRKERLDKEAAAKEVEKKQEVMWGIVGGIFFLVLVVGVFIMMFVTAPDELPSNAVGNYVSSKDPQKSLIVTSGGFSLGNGPSVSFTENSGGGYQSNSTTSGTWTAKTSDGTKCSGGMDIVDGTLLMTSTGESGWLGGDGGCGDFSDTWVRK